MVDWNPYLEALCNTYAQWWQVYTITDVVGQKRVELEPSPLLFDFGLMVQTVERDSEERGKGEEKVERLSVLEGLRKYASEHVLLVGRPGSGKSTALVRLVLEEAEKVRTPLNPPLVRGEENSDSLAPPLIRGAGGVKIPVLVELRYYRTSILDLIQDFLQRHDPNLTVDTETLKSWLRQGQLLLLVDGLNELPSEEARRDLHKLWQDYQKTTPMIFTTRDLGVGGDWDIAKRLEMQPLSEAQMQQFVHAYLPEQGEQMLRQLGSRLREFGQTPLLLWMLCSLFKAMGKVPPNLGLVFRQFTQQIYEGNLRLNSQPQIYKKTDVPVYKADKFNLWWRKLLEHLAFVMTRGDSLTEFQVVISKHQAENILIQFLNDKLKYPDDYANHWLQDLLRHHLIQLGTDNQKIEFRHQLIQEYYTAESLLKLLPSLNDDELKPEYLNYLKWTKPLALMLELLEDEAQALRVVKLALEVDLRLGARFVGAVKPQWQEQTVSLIAELKIPLLLKIQLLGLSKSEKAIPHLNTALAHEYSFVRGKAVEALGKIDNTAATEALIKALEHTDSDVLGKAIYALGKIGNAAATEALIKALEHEGYFVAWSAVDALGEIRNAVATEALIKALEHTESDVREKAVEALGKIGNVAATEALIKALEHTESDVREKAVEALGKIGNVAATEALIKALTHNDSGVREKAVEALGKIDNTAATEALSKALEHEDYFVRERAAETLSKTLEQEDSDVHERTAESLGEIGNAASIEDLSKALKHEDYSVRWSAVEALGKIGNAEATKALIKALEHKDFFVRLIAAGTLGKISNGEITEALNKALKHEDFVTANQGSTLDQSTEVLEAIQGRCQYYNYTLIQPIPTIATRPMHILHLSDLHFGTLDNARDWSNQLAADLYSDINISHLDALILSGDIANYSTEEEYQAAQQFLQNLRQDFPLNPEQIILVPGNHDLNWKLAKKAYKLIDRDDYDGKLIDGHYIEESASVIRVRDEAEYKQRFAHFSQFYETLKEKPYPLDYDQQYTLDHLPEQNLLILGLNSAWQLDHYYKSRASINTNALSNALTQIRRNSDYNNCLKIAVWHHPLNTAWEDRITDHGFTEQLAVAGFRLYLHGHIHKAETSPHPYDLSPDGRKLDRICAGTFGAPVREWVPGYPLQYNLLKIEDNQLTVYTRRREELNGAWKPDARWLQGAGKTPLDYYAIAL